MTFPDAEALLIGALSARLDVQVATDLPGDLERKLPVLQVTRVGGSKQHYPWSGGAPVTERVTCDLDAYADTREHAADLAQTCVAELLRLRGTVLDGAVVTDVIENVGPSWRPDYNPRVRRFGATYEIFLRPQERRSGQRAKEG